MAAVPSIGPAPSPSRSAEETSDLYARHHRQIFAFCLRELRNREEAEDATQSTFLNAFRALESGTVFEHESAWLYQAAHHVCQTRRRSWYRRRRIESDGDFDRLQHIIASPTSDDDELFGLRSALESMPEQQRKALLLREWQGLSYAEIATELELSQSAVETLLFRARRGLAERLTEEPAEEGRLRRVGRTGDYGSLGAAIKALFFSGGIKIAATLATVAATTVVASAPSVRNDVAHFVAPAFPEVASPVKKAPQHAKTLAAREASVQTSAPVVLAAPVTETVKAPRPAARRAHKHVVRVKHVAAPVVMAPVVRAQTAHTTTTAKVASVPATTTVAAPVVPPVTTSTTEATTTTTATTSTTATTTATTTTTPAAVGSAVRSETSPSSVPTAPPALTLTGFSPTSGLVGTIVSIGGGPFNHVISVKFNGVSAQFSSGFGLIARVPAGATSGQITVTTDAGASTTAGSFTVVTPSPPPPPPVPAPTLASFSPRTATVGATVLIVGAHLTGATTVAFNGVAASFTPESDSTLTAVVPAAATTGPVTVTTPQGTVTSSVSLTILAPPSVSSISPSSGVPGTTVTINGSHLSGPTSVRFNGVPANVGSSSDSSLTVQVPSGATTGAISVTTSSGSTTAGTFTVLAPPTVSSLTPTVGVAGTPVTVYGTHFTGTTAVTLNGQAAPFTVVSDSQLTVTVPAGATSGPIAITTSSGNTATAAFTVTTTTAPTIASLSTQLARIGTSVTITGTHFTGATSVKFDGVAASFTVNSDSQITATVPSFASSGGVTVSTPAGSVTSATLIVYR